MAGINETSVIETLQNAAAADGNGTAIDLKGYKRLTLQVSGTFTGAVVNFEGTIDDTNWFSVGLKTAADGAAVTASGAGAVGVWKLPADGPTLSQFRGRISGWATGTVTVKTRKEVR